MLHLSITTIICVCFILTRRGFGNRFPNQYQLDNDNDYPQDYEQENYDYYPKDYEQGDYAHPNTGDSIEDGFGQMGERQQQTNEEWQGHDAYYGSGPNADDDSPIPLEEGPPL